MHSLLNIILNTLVTLLRLVGPLLHESLSGVFLRERLTRTRRVNWVHWSLHLLLHGLPEGVFNFLHPTGDWQRLKEFLNLLGVSRNHRILLSGSVDHGSTK